MIKYEISVRIEGVIQSAVIEVHRTQAELRLIVGNTKSKIYKSHDCFHCFGLLRADFPHIMFLCKGARIDVYPSRMSSQMSCGMVAYQMELGRRADREDMVRIFDYEDTDITNNIREQEDFFKRWIRSLAGGSTEKYNKIMATIS